MSPVRLEEVLGEDLVLWIEGRIHRHQGFHQMLALEQPVPLPPEDGVLEHGPELSHVAVPGAAAQRREEADTELGNRNASRRRDVADESPGNGLDITGVLPKGR